MADVNQIKLPNGDIYTLKDEGALQLTGGNVTGPVSFGDSVSIDDLNAGQLVVSGSASVTNNLQVNTINGVTVGPSPEFTDSGGTVTSITLTQGTGISIGSSGTAITTSGTRTISLATITKSDTTSTASPAHSGTFTAIDSITYDNYGRVTGVNTKTITLPASGNTDTKVKITAVTPASETTNYPLTYTATSGTVEVNTHAYNRYWIKQGTTDATGYVYHGLGNNTATGTANNSQGWVRLYGSNTGYGQITYTNSTANTTHTLPATTGTILNTGTTSFTQSLTSGTTVGTIKINGTETTLYAPTNTDAKVTQSATTTSEWRKVLVHYTTNTSGADVPASVTNQVYAAKGIEVQPSTGTLHAEALTTKKITPLITGGSQTAAVTTSPYKPALWKFDAGIAPTNGNIVVIQAPGGGHSYGEFLSLDNGTTYKPITHSGTGKMTTHYASGSPIALIYDSDWTATSMYPLDGGTSTGTITGGAWRVINGYLDGNTYTTAYCSTAAATAAKTASMNGYVATAKRHVMINITTANTAASALTMNINGTGAKPIYINGSASSDSNHTLPAGSYLVYYDGTNYYFRTDGHLQSVNGILTSKAGTVTSVTLTQGTGITVSSSGTAITSSGSRTISLAYSVGDVIITSTNTNPSAHYGGTWELIDKEFKHQQKSDVFTLNTTYVTLVNQVVIWAGHNIWCRLRLNSKQRVDANTVIATMTEAGLGLVSSSGLPNYYTYAAYDGGYGVSLYTSWEAGVTSVTTRAPVVGTGTSMTPTWIWTVQNHTKMLDSFCDKFYWKRTA